MTREERTRQVEGYTYEAELRTGERRTLRTLTGPSGRGYHTPGEAARAAVREATDLPEARLGCVFRRDDASRVMVSQVGLPGRSS